MRETSTDQRPSPRATLGALDRSEGSAHRARRLRRSSLLGSAIPVFVVAYSALSWGDPNRPRMASLALVLLFLSAGIGASAGRLAASRLRQPVNIAAVVVHLCGYALFAYLDGGVASPLGMTGFVALVFLAIEVPYRPLAAFAVVVVAGYWAVVLFGEPAPSGYPWVYTMVYLAITAICARHARSLATLRHRLGAVARVDPLTGCLNRRGFDDRLLQERSKADRTGTPFTLVLVDLDAFKAVNDTHGHQTGDQLLRWTARTLQASARDTDVIGRVGGDEFAVILTGTDADGAGALVDRLRTALDEASPASMGAASWPAERTDIEELRHLADQRVYEDKARRSGRPAGVVEPSLFHAPADPGGDAATALTGMERRMASFTNIARLSALNHSVGLVHMGLFDLDAHDRPLRLGVFAVGLLLSLGMIWAAGSMVRSQRTKAVSTLAFGLIVPGVLVTLFDGGANSIYLIGMLTPLPIIALGTPKQISVPAAAAVLVNVVVQSVVLGAPSGWYVITHLFGILAVSIACGVSGAEAGRQRRLLKHLSLVDGLTDTLNRRGFEQRFEQEITATVAHGGELSLLVLDLDGFKAVNDTHGHAAGDSLLCWVTATLGELVRAHDVVGRLGGDEFVVLLADCAEDEVGPVAERIRTQLAERTAVSIGSATLGVHGDGFDDLYRHADAALYDDKSSRRGTRRPALTPTPAPAPAPLPEPVLPGAPK